MPGPIGLSDTTLRFLARFARPTQHSTREREVLFEAGAAPRPATIYLPEGADRSGPAWILLQGVTVPGRHHTGVRRMARALASAGQLAFVPEVPSWTALQVDPREAEPSVRAALDFLADWPGVDRRRVGLMGFSVAGTWALEVAAGELGRALRAVVGVGGYADFRRLLRVMIVGEHEWRGRRYRSTPDPYGRWIVAAQMLPSIDGDRYGTREQREQAARALHQLAITAGQNGALADQPVYDHLIGQLRQSVPGPALVAWDLLTPPSANPVPNPADGLTLADTLAEAALKADPLLHPAARLDQLRVPVVLLHGRQDRLIPFTESLRLAAMLPAPALRRLTVTRLLGHAKLQEAATPWTPLSLAAEAQRFVATIHELLALLWH